jgi:tetratricopeptide (TPR) repeat protein
MRLDPRRLAAASLLIAFAVASPRVEAQAGVSEASGEVVDQAGVPIEGAIVRFSAASSPGQVYKGKSNKKGRYYIPGLFTAKQGDTWNVEIEHPGYELIEAVIETRTVNKVLILKPDTWKAKEGRVGGFEIPKLGVAKVDLKLGDAATLAAERAQKAAAATAPAELAAAAPARDPWTEATSLAGAGQYEEAIPLFGKAIEQDPASLERRETYARVLAHLERYDEALVQLDSAVELAPERVEPRLLQAQVAMKQGDVEAAAGALEAARLAAPDDVRVWEGLADLAVETGERDDQIAALEAITRLRPADAGSWVALGDAYARAGRLEESEAAYQRVVDLDPENAYRTYYNLAVFNLNREGASDADRRRAIESLKRAVAIKPDYAQAYKELGLALIGAGEGPAAKEALEKYLSLKPDAADATQMRAIAENL